MEPTPLLMLQYRSRLAIDKDVVDLCERLCTHHVVPARKVAQRCVKSTYTTNVDLQTLS
jgi:hypothetical protein